MNGWKIFAGKSEYLWLHLSIQRNKISSNYNKHELRLVKIPTITKAAAIAAMARYSGTGSVLGGSLCYRNSGSPKHEAVRLRFMHRRCASYILMLDEQSSQAQNVLHTAKPCFIKAWRWSIVSVFISLRRDKPLKLHNMKHLHFIPIWSTSLTLRMM